MTVISDWTDEQLMAIPHIGKTELINGKVIMAPNGSEHSDVASNLVAALVFFVRAKKLGRAYESSAGYRMKSGNVFAPDVSFISAVNLKGRRADYKRFYRGAPDLAVEIFSPNDSRRDLAEKIHEYFENGTTLMWVVEPDTQTVTIYTTPDHPSQKLTLADSLSAGELLPGFAITLVQLFESPDFD